MSHTHLGTKQLHERHTVAVEGGTVPRARVMDQTELDRLLMDGLITLAEFRAGEYMLEQAQIAAMWPKGANLQGVGGGKPGSRVPFGVFRWGNPLKSVRKHCGEKHAHILAKVIITNCDISDDPDNLRRLKQALKHISDCWIGHKDPLRHIRSA